MQIKNVPLVFLFLSSKLWNLLNIFKAMNSLSGMRNKKCFRIFAKKRIAYLF